MSLERLKLFLLVAIAVFVPLAIAESYFRSTQRFSTYCERTFGYQCFDSDFGMLPYPWLATKIRNSKFESITNEYVTSGEINSEGFFGKAFADKKEPTAYRILFLGDSFTFGIGAPGGKGFVEDVGRYFEGKRMPRNIEVMNAGRMGSDPIFYLQILKRQMLKYQPDLVVMMVNQSDVDDIVKRGGNERFNDSGWLKERKMPWFTPLFRSSHLVRSIIIGLLGYDWNLFSPLEVHNRTQLAPIILTGAGKELKSLSEKEGFKHLVLFSPYATDLYSGHSQSILQAKEGLSKAGVAYDDITDFMAREIPKNKSREYYWPIDLHFNEKGYAVFANAVVDSIVKARVLPHSIQEKLAR